MKFLENIKKIGLYNGLEKNQYLAIKEELNAYNRSMLIILSAFTMSLFALMIFVSFTFGVIEKNKSLYVVGFITFSSLFLISKFSNLKKFGGYKSLALLWIITFVSMGIFFAVKPSSINEKTTLFLIFPFIGPMFFCITGIPCK